MTMMRQTMQTSSRTIRRVVPFVALLGIASSAFADNRLAAVNAVAEGKRLLEAGKFDDALDYFKKAEVDLPDSAEIAYDRGIALYRKTDFDKAKDAFMNALRTRDPVLEAKAKFNLGNCAYSTALQKLTDLSGAIDELRKAITYWRDSLDLNPEDTEARQNIETAQLLIKDLLDKEKKRQEEEKKQQQNNPQSQPTSQPDQKDQQQDQQKKDKDKQDQNKQNQQDKDQQKKDQQKNQQSNPQQQQKQQPRQDPKDQQGKDKQKEKEKQEQQKKKDQQDMQRQKAQQKKDQMSREDAERKLQAIRDKERARREEKRRREAMEAGRMPVDRDW